MADVFVYGTLQYRALLDLVLGRGDVDAAPARLSDVRVAWAEGESFPLIVAGGPGAEGLLLRKLTDRDLSRLDFYEGGFGYGARVMAVETGEGPVGARVYWPDAGRWIPGADWSLADWVRDWGPLTREAAEEVMAQHGRLTPGEVARRFPFIRARAWSRVMARSRVAPQSLRSPADAASPRIVPRSGGHDGFFRLRTFEGSFLRFDGSRTEPAEREVFQGFDAALVLPYDPVRDTVLMVEQFRYGVSMRGDPCSRVLEPVAGMVDPGEDPADTARREAQEESGLDLGDLHRIAGLYASPGYSTDFFHCYLGLCDLDFVSGRIGGHPDEDEDIRSHVIPFEDALALVESGEANVAPLAMMILWLAAHRDRLRAGAQGGAG